MSVAHSHAMGRGICVRKHVRVVFLLLMLAACGLVEPPARATAAENAQAPIQIPIVDGPSIQRALDSQPGRIVFLPPGDYTLTAWHEQLGTKEIPVKVEAGKPASVEIKFPAP